MCAGAGECNVPGGAAAGELCGECRQRTLVWSEIGYRIPSAAGRRIAETRPGAQAEGMLAGLRGLGAERRAAVGLLRAIVEYNAK